MNQQDNLNPINKFMRVHYLPVGQETPDCKPRRSFSQYYVSGDKSKINCLRCLKNFSKDDLVELLVMARRRQKISPEELRASYETAMELLEIPRIIKEEDFLKIVTLDLNL